MDPVAGVGELNVNALGAVASITTAKVVVALLLPAVSFAVTVRFWVEVVAPLRVHEAVYTELDADMLSVDEQPIADASTRTLSIAESVTVVFNVTVWPFVAEDWAAGYIVVLARVAGFVVSSFTVRVALTAVFPVVSLTKTR